MKESFVELGTQRLCLLAEQIGLTEIALTKELFSLFLEPWGKLPVGKIPRYASSLSDDGSPFEFSIAFDDGNPELRFLVEAQGCQPTNLANWIKAQEINSILESKYGVSLDRFRKIESLFAPKNNTCRFGAWHAVCFSRGNKPEFKIYLNPQIHGKAQAHELVTKALNQLGFDGAQSTLMSRLGDEIIYFSLDLSSDKGARVKIYTAHFGATAKEIDQALRVTKNYQSEQIVEFCRVVGLTEGPYLQRPVQTCLSFTDGNSIPVMGTVHFPIRSYVNNDVIARDRILSLLDEKTAALYTSILQTFANRSLESGRGMQSYVSLRQRGKSGNRLTVYLATELFATDTE